MVERDGDVFDTNYLIPYRHDGQRSEWIRSSNERTDRRAAQSLLSTSVRYFTVFGRRTRKIYHQNALAVTNGAITTDHCTLYSILHYSLFPLLVPMLPTDHRVVVGGNRPFSPLPTHRPMVPEI